MNGIGTELRLPSCLYTPDRNIDEARLNGCGASLTPA